jgi:iron-sulfur cluster assembly accessory protein
MPDQDRRVWDPRKRQAAGIPRPGGSAAPIDQTSTPPRETTAMTDTHTHSHTDGHAHSHDEPAGATVTTTIEAPATTVQLTDTAAVKVKSLLEQEGRDDLALRIAVQPGGCSGLRYQLFFDERSLDGDVVTDFGGVKVVVDRMSSPYLGGASIDFVDTIEKQGFTIDNPNAGGSCACGDSFS